MKKSFLLAVAALVVTAAPSMAAIIEFDLVGKAGTGLLPGNQNSVINGTPGVGGELGAGILYNDVTNVLTMNTGWGTGNGFASNLTGAATAGHLHGPVASAAPASFLEDAGVQYPIDSLPGWNTSASNGGFVGTINILEGDEPALLAGRFYMNVHTVANGPGEIRGNLVVVPEPASVALISLSAAALLLRRRRAV